MFKVVRLYASVILLSFIGLTVIQMYTYSNDVDQARERALFEWAGNDMNRRLQVKAFKQNCDGKTYVYDCASKHGGEELTAILLIATESIIEPIPARWIPDLHKERRHSVNSLTARH